MSLKYLDGFETCRDDTDFRNRGYVAGPTKVQAAFVPSITTVAGTSLKKIGPFPAASPNVTVGTAGSADLGYLNLGITVNQAWLAGGFTVGIGARQNSGVANAYGSGNVNNCDQIAFDGSLYWAIQQTGTSTFNVATSPDLINWTATSTQPAIGMSSSTTISALSGGIVVIVQGTANSTVQTIQFTSNGGSSWATQNFGTVLNGAVIGSAASTGNSAFPHVLSIITAAGSANNGQVFVGTIGGTMTQVATFTNAATAAGTNCARIRVLNGLILILGPTVSSNVLGVMASATASNVSLNTTGAWTAASGLTAAGTATDIAYNPVSNLWVLTGSAGIFTFPNTGAAGTAVSPAGAQTLTSRYTTVGMSNVWWTGSIMVAHGQQGHIVTSPDGITWTEEGAHILPVGVSGTDWRASIFDGTRYVLVSDATNGVIATTPDFQTNFAAKYVMDGPEELGSLTVPSSHMGIFTGTAPAPSTGLWAANSTLVTVFAPTPTAGVRTLELCVGNNAAEVPVFNLSTSTLEHYFEIVGVAGATVNTFTYQLWVDGLLAIQGAAPRALAGTTDATSLMIFSFNRFNNFNAYDDMYVTLSDGQNLVGPLGIVNVVGRRPSTDVSDQWVKTGSAASNALSVNQPALSSLSTNFVTSTNAGDKDVYTSADAIPAGFSAKAVQLEGYFTKTSTTAPTVNLGLISSGTEVDGANATIAGTGAQFVTSIIATDPHGNIPWTNTSIGAAEIVLNHVS